MKAIRIHEFGDPKVMKLEDVPDPKAGPGQVVVRVRAIGVNPVEVYMRSGNYPRKPALPFTPGLDAAGVVEAVGDGVKNVRKGDRVYTVGTLTGAYAEMTLCDAHRLYTLPEKITFQQGAAITIPYATAYRALFLRGHALAGEWILVHGASGGVGIAAVQLGRAYGMKVIGTAGTDRGKKLVEQEGAHHVLDHKAAAYMDEVMKLTGDRGVDVILENLANVNLGKDLPLLAKKGRVVVVGSRGTVEINPRDAMMRDA
ncbi:MAG TPA: NADPH:quinone reductase, partial [Candidatus Sulfotelmatobacter sp.]|nr:NADPH:quinone reductase [Candidatus Sulfotelmatobacter sp.]